MNLALFFLINNTEYLFFHKVKSDTRKDTIKGVYNSYFWHKKIRRISIKLSTAISYLFKNLYFISALQYNIS